MDNMLDIDTNIASFQKELKKVKNELLALIPMDVKISFLEEEKICEQNHYDLYYLRDRDSIYRNNLSYPDWMISNIIKNKQWVKFRREQYTLLKKELGHLEQGIKSQLSLLERSLKEDNEMAAIEALLRNTSLVTFKNISDEIQPLTSPNGYIYLIKEYITNTYKIGRTSNPKNRLDIFNVKLPFKWDLVALYSTRNMIILESNLHELFTKKRKNGEWFNLDEDDLLLFYEIMTGNNITESQEKFKNVDEIVKDVEDNFPNEIDQKYIFANSVRSISELVKQKLNSGRNFES
ncbi:hypothetical protein Bmyc01_53170 [Bacillus mycoides]|nr:hypothetical protein Bmyc01_53170 [Bacillus mycoides]